ncbi:unnamed protein product [Parnassius apollo]|uniref:(apollo) hypothetical protein n=1 Tax=Parnassius apollo TaxID=110799 RepID=A0A8S3XIL0_PARAO|nr:unnamed protein product [Parnassius apollo]
MDVQLTNNLKEIENMLGSRMLDYEEKLKKASTETNSSHPDLSSLSREFSELKCFVWQTLSRLKIQIEMLCLGLDRHETAMRHKVLLFHGIPEKPNENLHYVLYSIISNQLKLTDLSKDSLKVCHRLGSAQGKTRPVLVRFFETEHR